MTRRTAPHRRTPSFRPTLLAAALCAVFASAQAGNVRADGRLTIYSGDFEAVAQSEVGPGGPGFALAERDLPAQWHAGSNQIPVSKLPRAIDAASIVVAPPAGVTVAGQRFDFALAGQDELLRRALGQTVVVEQAVGDARERTTGTLVSAGNGLTLRLPDGRIRVLAHYASFELPALPSGIVEQPTLQLQLDAARAGSGSLHLSYATAGLAWRAEYTARLRGQGRACRMDLDGAALVANRAGADVDDVALTLVAGEPHREKAQAVGVAEDSMRMRAMAAPAPMAPQPEASGEYQAYRLPGRGSLPQGSVQRLPLVAPASGIACERRYETSASMGDWRPPFPIVDENWSAGDGQAQPVQATLRFTNDEAAGLGVPLPAGRVRVFDGRDFLGEAAIGHTPALKDVALVLGEAFDLGATRTRESFQLDRVGRTMTETVRIELSNAKTEPVTVRVNERLGRWSDWDIVSSSVPAQKRDAQTAAFDVALPAGGKTTLSYTVRYRWAEDVKLP